MIITNRNFCSVELKKKILKVVKCELVVFQVMGTQMIEQCKLILEGPQWALWMKEVALLVVASILGVLSLARICWYCTIPGKRGVAFPLDQ